MSYKNIAKLKRAVPSLSIDCSKGGRTQQNFRKVCDINSIMEKARKTGFVQHLNGKSPIYGDFTNIPDYQDALNKVIYAEQQFMKLPAKTRTYFDNDPQKLFDFVDNDANYEEAVKLGLVEKKPEIPPVSNPAQDGQG